MSNIKLLRLLTGEDIIAEVMNDIVPTGITRVKNPVRLILMENKAGMVRWIEMSGDTVVDIQNFHIVAKVELIPQMLEQYKRAFGKILTPDSGLILP